ncbi:MAG: epoxyqueuosine reductase QueH [Peptococcaceae bacterium]|nr:epoxyqueuosine reductase QueH [Peptococcaceae bacterium]
MNPRNYQRELDRIIKNITRTETVPKLLLHSCCGPCSSYVLEYLAPYFEIVLFYDNPNIQPRAEYDHRLAEQRRVIAHTRAPHGIRLIEGDYDPARYARAVKGLTHLPEGSERCFACYRFRMEAAAALAKRLGCEYFATTLSISPYKNADAINAIGEEIAEVAGVAHLPNDFKKRGGYQRSIVLCKAWDIYRQHYCGCIFSQREWEARTAAQREKESSQ